MNARNLGLVGLLAAVAAGCHSDPTNSLVGKPARVGFQFATVRLEVADSLATFAVLLDEGSTPIAEAVTITACDPTTVTVSGVAAGTPLVQTNFFIKGIKYGTACVVATASGLIDTMQVATVPDQIKITSGPDTILSGDSGQYTFAYYDKKGNVMTGVPIPSWSSATTSLGNFGTATVANYVTASPGVNTIKALVSISALGGTVTAKDSVTKVVATIPSVFPGTVAPLTAAPATTVLAEGGILPTWKSASSVDVGLQQAFVVHTANDSVRFVMPPFGNTTAQPVLFLNLGAKNLATQTPPATYVSNPTASLDGPFFPGDTDVTANASLTLPHVKADTNIIYDVNHGTCTGGSNTSPGDHCNAFFLLNNNTASPDTINIQLDWVSSIGIDNPPTGSNPQTGPDQDILLCDSVCGGFVGNFNGATTATPEKTTVIIPANTKWNLWINLFDPFGQQALLFRVMLTHK